LGWGAKWTAPLLFVFQGRMSRHFRGKSFGQKHQALTAPSVAGSGLQHFLISNPGALDCHRWRV
jgi:hypothetical protein